MSVEGVSGRELPSDTERETEVRCEKVLSRYTTVTGRSK